MRSVHDALCSAVLALLVSAVVCIAGPATAAPSDYETDVLRICEGVIHLFEQHGDEIWPGYSLAERPFVVYVPGKWVLLFNAGRDVEEFGPCPADWPDIGVDLLYHEGSYGNLVGQLAFDYDVNGIRTVAVGFPESLPESMENVELKMFGYIVHEAFHQYQNEVFGDTPWAREQRYPIEDGENAALAYIEMVILIDAIKAAGELDDERCRESVERFLAVRDHRWERADPFVATYEQGEEVKEGTARYVELTSFDLAGELTYSSSVDGAANPLAEHFASATMPGYLVARFGDRMGDGYVPIEDLFRNRIYAVGSAQAFLLDHFGIEWRPEARQGTAEFTYAELLRDGLAVDETRFPSLLEEAKRLYDHADVLAASGEEVERYAAGYRGELDAFESQPGYRIEIALSSNGVSRSRVSTAKKWVVEKGTRSLCSHYKVYTLESDDLFLEVHDTALLEENDWDAYWKKVAFYAPEIASISLDGETASPDDVTERSFESIEMVGDGFELTHSEPGTISIVGDRVSVDVVPPPE